MCVCMRAMRIWVPTFSVCTVCESLCIDVTPHSKCVHPNFRSTEVWRNDKKGQRRHIQERNPRKPAPPPQASVVWAVLAGEHWQPVNHVCQTLCHLSTIARQFIEQIKEWITSWYVTFDWSFWLSWWKDERMLLFGGGMCSLTLLRRNEPDFNRIQAGLPQWLHFCSNKATDDATFSLCSAISQQQQQCVDLKIQAFSLVLGSNSWQNGCLKPWKFPQLCAPSDTDLERILD